MAYDFEGAFGEGHDSGVIARYLANKHGYDYAGARQEGHDDDTILMHLAKKEGVSLVPDINTGSFAVTPPSAIEEAVKGFKQGAYGQKKSFGGMVQATGLNLQDDTRQPNALEWQQMMTSGEIPTEPISTITGKPLSFSRQQQPPIVGITEDEASALARPPISQKATQLSIPRVPDEEPQGGLRGFVQENIRKPAGEYLEEKGYEIVNEAEKVLSEHPEWQAPFSISKGVVDTIKEKGLTSKEARVALVRSLSESAPQMAATKLMAVAGGLTGNPVLAGIGIASGVGASYMLGGGDTFNSLVGQGAPEQEAARIAHIVGTVNAGLETTGLGLMFEKIPALRKAFSNNVAEEVIKQGLFKRMGKAATVGAITEGPLEEFWQTVVSNAAEKLYNENKDLFEGAGEATLVGSVMGLLGGGVAGIKKGGGEVVNKYEPPISEAWDVPGPKQATRQKQFMEGPTVEAENAQQPTAPPPQQQYGEFTPEQATVPGFMQAAPPTIGRPALTPEERALEAERSVQGYQPGAPGREAYEYRRDIFDELADQDVALQQREDMKARRRAPLALPSGQGFELVGSPHELPSVPRGAQVVPGFMQGQAPDTKRPALTPEERAIEVERATQQYQPEPPSPRTSQYKTWQQLVDEYQPEPPAPGAVKPRPVEPAVKQQPTGRARPFNYETDTVIENLDEIGIPINQQSGRVVTRKPWTAGQEQNPKVLREKLYKTRANAALALRELAKKEKVSGDDYGVVPVAGGWQIQNKVPARKSHIEPDLAPAFAMMKEQVNAGAPGRFETGNEGEGWKVTSSYPSTYPQWFRDGKWTRAEFESIIRKMESGHVPAKNETRFWDRAYDLEQAARALMENDPGLAQAKDAEELAEKGFDPAFKEMPAGELQPGDKITMGMEEYEHKGYDDDGNAILKDGETRHVDPFEMLPVEGIKKRGKDETNVPPTPLQKAGKRTIEDAGGMASPGVRPLAGGTQNDLTQKDGAQQKVVTPAENDKGTGPAGKGRAGTQNIPGAKIDDDELINGITRARAGKMMAEGDAAVLEHIRQGVKQHGVMAMEDAIRNQEIAEVVATPKGEERKTTRENLARLRPQIDLIFAEARKGKSSPEVSTEGAGPASTAAPASVRREAEKEYQGYSPNPPVKREKAGESVQPFTSEKEISDAKSWPEAMRAIERIFGTHAELDEMERTAENESTGILAVADDYMADLERAARERDHDTARSLLEKIANDPELPADKRKLLAVFRRPARGGDIQRATGVPDNGGAAMERSPEASWLEESARKAGKLTGKNEEIYGKLAEGAARLGRSERIETEHAAEALQYLHTEIPKEESDYARARRLDVYRSGGVPVDTPKFSKETRASAKQKSTIAEVKQLLLSHISAKGLRGLLDSGRLRIVQTAGELPSGVPYSENGSILAMYHNDKVYLVADNLNAGSVKGVLLHEFVHAELDQNGWQGLLGDKFEGIKAQVGRMLGLKHKGLVAAQERAKRAVLSAEELERLDSLQGAAKNGQLSPGQKKELEVLRDKQQQDKGLLFEETVTYFIQDRANQSTTLFQRILRAVNAWLLRHGFKKTLSADDLVGLAESALKRQAKNASKERAAERAGDTGDMIAAFSKQFGITVEEAQRQYDEVVRKFRDTGQWMKAPNGEPTKLNERQWVQVRTPAFKEWFGDSKVVDKNGEPRVVYHGTFSDFSRFNLKKLGKNTKDNASTRGYRETAKVGFWFNTSPTGKSPEKYGAGYSSDIPVFLNIVTPRREMSLSWLSQALEEQTGRSYRKDSIEEGYDGLSLPDEEFGEESYVVFTPNQVKSAIGNTGQFSPHTADVRYSKAQIQAAAKAIYSKLQQAAESFQGMKAQGVMNWLAKQGVKKVEMDAAGIPEFLAGKKPADKVTREELEGFVQANAVELEDVVLGGSFHELSTFSNEQLNRMLTAEDIEIDPAWTRVELENEVTEAIASGGNEAEINMREAMGELPTFTHFSQYTEPGAVEGSYREAFVTAKGNWKADHSKFDASIPAGQAPVGRYRFDEVNADGKRIMRVEEVQNMTKGIRVDGIVFLNDKEGRKNAEERAAKTGKPVEHLDRDNKVIPTFLAENAYPILVKRILAYAKENGFDGVGFATRPNMSAGETQADRYDLSKQVGYIRWAKESDEKYNLRVFGVTAGQKLFEDVVDAKTMENVIGKDLTRRITESPKNEGKLEGIDLQMGGEGLKKLYDQDLPRMLEAYGKGKMDEIGIDVNTGISRVDRFEIVWPNGEVVQTAKTELMASGFADKMNKEKGGGYSYRDTGASTKKMVMPYLPITAQTPASYPMFAKELGGLPEQDVEESTNFVRDAVSALRKRNKGFIDDAGDTSLTDRLLSLPSHYFKKIPGLKKMYDHAMGRRDNFYRILHTIIGDDAAINAHLKKLEIFEKERPEEFLALQKYLKRRDQNSVGWRVKETKNGTWELFTPAGKLDGKFDTEQAAVDAMVESEASAYRNSGASDQAVDALMATRTTTNNGFNILFAGMRRVIDIHREAKKPLPEVTIRDADNNIIKVDLEQAMKEMGELRGSYMPRIRKPGKYTLRATKGDKKILLNFDTKMGMEFKASKYRNEGYAITKQRSDKLPEDIFEMAGNIISMQAVINKAIDEASGKGKSLDDLGWTATQGKDILHVAPKDFKGEEKFQEVFTFHGGTWGDKGWEFKKAGKNLEASLLRSINAAQAIETFDTRAIFAKALAESVADVMRTRGPRVHMRGRVQGPVWEGYEENPTLALGQYARGIAAGEAKKELALNLVRAFTGTTKSWQEFKAEEEEKGGKADYADYMDFVRAERIEPNSNAFHDGKVFMEDVLRNQEAADRVMGVIRGVAVLKYLGFRVLSSPAVNLTSLVTSVPATMHKAGVPAVAIPGMLAKAGRLYYAHKFGGDLSAEEKELFKTIEDNGWDNAQFNREALSALEGKLERHWGNLMEMAMFAFGVSERINRVTTIAGTYLGLKAAHKGEWDGKARKEALEKAKQASDDAHGTYDRANLPHYARGAHIGAQAIKAFYTFKTYAHNYLVTMAKYGWGSEKDRLAAAYMAVAPAIIAGSGASVLAPLLKALIPGDDPEEKFYKWLNSEYGEGLEMYARYGVAGLGGKGVSLKGSMQLTGELPTSLKDILGAPAAIFEDVYEGGKSIAKGDTSKGFERAFPTAMSTLLRGYRESTEGLTTRGNVPVLWQGKPVVADDVEAAFRYAGFSPARLTRIREIKRADKLAAKDMREEKGGIYDRLRRFYLDPPEKRDKARYIDLMSEVKEYNEDAVKKGMPLITPRSIKQALRAKQPKMELRREQQWETTKETEE